MVVRMANTCGPLNRLESVSTFMRQVGQLLRTQFSPLVALAATSNLVAFMVSSHPLGGAVELNSAVQPGFLSSLVRTEGLVLLASVVIVVFVRKDFERIALQSLVTSLFFADAVNDVFLILTNNLLITAEASYVAAASVPLVMVLRLRRDKTQAQARNFWPETGLRTYYELTLLRTSEQTPAGRRVGFPTRKKPEIPATAHGCALRQPASC
jgi:hypothetical protein